jgi:hypothetical protein
VLFKHHLCRHDSTIFVLFPFFVLATSNPSKRTQAGSTQVLARAPAGASARGQFLDWAIVGVSAPRRVLDR